MSPDYKNRGRRSAGRSVERGFTLVEVLVAAFVLAIGLLGMAGMQAVGVKESQNTYFRTQADMLVSDMVDRMRANRAAVASGAATSAYEYDGSSVANPASCDVAGANCDADQMASFDLNAWQQAIQNSKLPSGSGSISRNAGSDSAYTIQVFWDEKRDGSGGQGCDPSNASDMPCIRLVVQF